MPPKCFESEVESFLEGSHGDRTHNKQRADHHTVTPLCGTLLFAHEARQRGDVETTNTTARPQQGTAETDITTAPENCTKKAHFTPAKAMAVSTHHRHERAKETGVSGNRAAWPTGPDHSARGRWLGQSAAPVGNIRYKRRQTNAIHIASRGPLLQTSSI